MQNTVPPDYEEGVLNFQKNMTRPKKIYPKAGMPTQRPKYVVSACLAGVRCAYDGEHRRLEKVVELVSQGLAVPVCPEQLGGLPTPRPPVEISNGRVVDQKGNDLSLNFERGAKEAFKLCSMAGCSRAILKSRSPSCGSGCVYDGTFQGQRTSGDGIFASLLKASGIAVFTDEEVDSLPPEESCA